MDIGQARVIVAGGASGLGAATARRFREMGAQVTIFDRDATAGREMAAEIAAGFCEADVTQESSLQSALDTAVSEMGSVSVCINCAGIATGERVLGRDGPHALSSFQRTIDVNLVGSFNLMRLAAAAMAENTPNADGERGVIVHTASIAAFEGQKGQAAYAASKAGIAGVVLPAARDLASLGIRVMAIAPGIFRTPMLESLGQEIMDGLAANVVFPKRLGQPEEFAALAEFIVRSAYLNGQTIRIDGALRMP